MWSVSNHGTSAAEEEEQKHDMHEDFIDDGRLFQLLFLRVRARVARHENFFE